MKKSITMPIEQKRPHFIGVFFFLGGIEGYPKDIRNRPKVY